MAWIVTDSSGASYELRADAGASPFSSGRSLRAVLNHRGNIDSVAEHSGNRDAFADALAGAGVVSRADVAQMEFPELAAAVTRAVAGGALRLVRRRTSFRPLLDMREIMAEPLAEDAAPPVSEPEPEEFTTWFEVIVVDELGEPLDGVELSLFVDGEDRRMSTDADGKARVDDATMGNGTVTIADPAGLRELVKPRWEQIREGDWLDSEDQHTYLGTTEPMPVVQIESKKPHTLVVQPRTVLARIRGMLFDTNKAFMLPKALDHLPRLTALYADHPDAIVVAVGHTDTSGDNDYNDALSLERAEAMAAFLRDDPAPWLDWYDSGKPSSKRWGAHEDKLMLDAVLERTGEEVEGSPLRHFQGTRGLSADGIAGPITREALITEYMGADDTSLPDGAQVLVHGCGESFPLDDSGDALDQAAADGQSDARDRRVELFFFDGELGVLPPAPGDISGPDDPEYAEWRKRAIETHEYDVDGHVHSVVIDDPLFGVAADLSVELTYEEAEPEVLSTDGEGRLPIEPSRGAFVDLRYTWHEQEIVRRVFTGIDDVASPDGAWQRLCHLGYASPPEPERTPPDDDALGDALMLFQLDYGVEPSGEQDDETVAMLLRAHDQDLRPWRDRDWELPDEPEPDADAPKEQVA